VAVHSLIARALDDEGGMRVCERVLCVACSTKGLVQSMLPGQTQDRECQCPMIVPCDRSRRSSIAVHVADARVVVEEGGKERVQKEGKEESRKKMYVVSAAGARRKADMRASIRLPCLSISRHMSEAWRVCPLKMLKRARDV
jgi:hypothetical protein